MTNPEQPTGPAQPARAAGYALLGVAVIALVIGLVSLFTGGPDGDAAGAPPTTTPPGASQPGTSETPGTSGTSQTPGQPTGDPTSSPPAPTTGSTAPTTAGNPGTTAATDPLPPPVTAAPRPPVRVYNNSTTQGLAADASADVEKAGWQVAEKGNYSQGLIPTTTVYFRPGTGEEASARELAQLLGARVEPRFTGIQDAAPGIIVIVTNDYKGTPAKVS